MKMPCSARGTGHECPGIGRDRRRSESVDLDIGRLDDFFPAGDFLLLECAELVRRIGDDFEAQAVQRLGDVGLLQRIAQRAGQAVHDVVRRVLGNGEALPRVHHDIVVAQLPSPSHGCRNGLEILL